MLADQERGARATATSPPMDSNLAVEKFLARRGGRGRGLSLSLFLFFSLLSLGHVIRETLISSRAKS